MANAEVFNQMSRKGLPTRREGDFPQMSTEPNPFAGTVDVFSGMPTPPDEPAAAAPSMPAPGRYRDIDGKYEYELGGDGSITIVKSTRSNKPTVVAPDTVAYDAIMSMIKTQKPMAAAAGAEADDFEIKPSKGMKIERVPPSGRASTAEKEAYADDLLGPVEKAGQYGSAETVRPSYTDGEGFTLEGPDITAPAKGQYGSMGALREAEMSESPEAMARGKAMTQAEIEKSDMAKRKEMSGLTSRDVTSTMKRASLLDGAAAGLMKAGLDKRTAEIVAQNIFKGVQAGDYTALESLKKYAGQ